MMARLRLGSSPTRRYLAALAIAAVAILLRLALAPLMGDQARYLLLEPAVVASAWLGGMGPGIVAALVTAIVAPLLFMDQSAAGADPIATLSAFVAYAVIGSGLAWLTGQLRRGWDAERAARADLTAILDSVADGVTVIDATGTMQYANAAAAELTGTSVEAMLGSDSAAVVSRFEMLDESGAALDVAELPTRRVAAGAEQAESTVRFRGPDGVERWSIVRARAIRDRHGTLERVVSAFQEVTEIKASERRLAFLAEVSAVLAESTDYEQTLRQIAGVVVPQLADWCVVDVAETGGLTRVATTHVDPGRRRLADEIGRRWPREPGASEVLGRVMQTRRPVLIGEVTDEMLRTSARDEEHLTVLRKVGMREVLCVPLEAREHALGTMTLIMAESRRTFAPGDVTLAAEIGRRGGAAIDAARLLQDAQEAIELRDEFMAVASHDMRTPLATVGGYVQLVRRQLEGLGAESDAALGMLDKAEVGIARLNRLVADMLDVTLLRSGELIPMQVETVDLRALVQEVANEHRINTEAGRRIETELTAVLPPVRADRDRLLRVLDNLVGNALKYGAAETPICLRLERQGGAALIRVVDHGPGIHPEDLPHIFEPHFRGRNAGDLPGSGLGLSGARAVMEQMGGSLEATSEPGSGSTFTVRVPLTEALPEVPSIG